MAHLPSYKQYICTECGDPFAASMPNAKTCGERCRKRRQRRQKAGDSRDYAFDATQIHEAWAAAKELALDHLPDVAQQVLADEMRPIIREALTDEVLSSIDDMMGLMALSNKALSDALRAATFEFNEDGTPMVDQNGDRVVVADHDTRLKAAAMVHRVTLLQPGLAPQPEQPDAAPIVVNFGSMPAISQAVEGSAHEVIELDEGERLCDMCALPKPADEFVGSSSRCLECHLGNRKRIETAIEERTRPAS